MKNLLKKLTMPAYLYPLCALIALAALLVAVSSCADEGFGMAEMPVVISATVIVVVLAALLLVNIIKCGDGVITTVLAYLLVLALAVCVYAMVMGKSAVFGTVIFSALERGYEPAERASAMGVVSIVMYLVSAACAVVGAFFPLSREAA